MRKVNIIEIDAGTRSRAGWNSLNWHVLAVGIWFLLTASACQAQPENSQAIAEPSSEIKSFSEVVNRLSEPGGYFDTDNLISNESSYLHVIPSLHELNIKGGVYLGVGPDQNFSYIAHIQPELAIIVDIRRDNMLLHLMYKAIFSISDNRSEFFSNLFGRPVSLELKDKSLEEMFDALDKVDALAGKERENLIARIEGIIESFGVELSPEDWSNLRRFHSEFISEGSQLQFRSHGRSSQSYYPTYRRLATETTLDGKQEGFLGEEEYFQRLKTMHAENRIIPVVGNFAGSHALKEVSVFLKERDLLVSSYYTSNVEYYLMQQLRYNTFQENLKMLPVQENAIFIRSYFNRWRANHPLSVNGYGSTQIIQPLKTVLEMENPTYRDLLINDIVMYNQ